MSLPLVILAIFSIFFGFITKEIYIGLGTGFFENSIYIHPLQEVFIDTEFGITSLLKLIPLTLTIFVIVLSIIIHEFYPYIINNFKWDKLGYLIYGFFNQRFYIELLYNKYIVNLVLICGGQTSKVLDKGSIEYLGPYGLQKLLLFISKIINNFSNGIITNYALYIMVGIMTYLIYINSSNIMFIIPFLLIIILTITIGFFNFYDNKNNLDSKFNNKINL
jgi:NADH-ubiquinone oxidoreductase chain 5